ncbi:hypothetical protein R9X47_07930 [Wukongibacter baidiensis]|uniref:hypothetical protein n=1 Tax=Wukongibacter baidiensis TaxID=1723361 RepID=UPI003D7F260B
MVIYILGHLVLSCLIAFLGLDKINKQERFCNFIIALFFPVGGYITVLILYLSRNKNPKEIENEPDIEDALILFTERFDRQRDTNIVPLEETLLINDTKVKREQLINALKKESSKYIDMLKVALRDEDVETSHYAASAIADIKGKLDLKLQAFSVEYEKNKLDTDVLKQYADTLEEYLNSNLLDEYARRKTIFTYIGVLENLLKSHGSNSDYYNRLINVLYEVNEIDKAKKYCKEYLENCKDEGAYLANLKYFYLIKDKTGFNDVFDSLLGSSIKLSNKGLSIIRFWLDGV